MMLTKITGTILFSGMISFILSCSPKTISTKYYYRHEKALDGVEVSYKELYRQQPFTIAFTDREFNTLSLEIITDTLSYIYAFNVSETRLADTLAAYHFNAPKVLELIRQMQSIRCTWVNKLDYYVDEKKNTLILISIKPVALNAPFSYKKYYTLIYFPRPQYFDSTGQLLDKKTLRRLRKINGEIFNRINDKVCYAISGNFR
jgi:hypothetical protein